MRVLLVNDYATLTGGAEIVVAGLRDGLRARGHEARIFASTATPGGARPAADAYAPGTTSRWRTLLQTANPMAVQSLRRELAAFRPDVVHVNLFLTQLSPLILPVLRDTPAVFHGHWYRAVCPTGVKTLPDGRDCHARPGRACLRDRCLPIQDWGPLMLQEALWRRWRGVFDRIVVNSEAVGSEFRAAGLRPVEVVHYGLTYRGTRGALAGPPLALFAGRLVREKGVDILLQAFRQVRERVPAARLLIAGDGPERNALTKLATQLGLGDSVAFAGHLDQGRLEAAAQAAWVQAVPSLWREPFGLVAAEAMLRGTAVVASRAGGLPEFIAHEKTGLLVDQPTPEAWASALSSLLGDRERAETLGRQAAAAARARFSMDRFLERMEAVYRGAIAEHGLRRRQGERMATASTAGGPA